jgi:GNAT superfamily N-acetyltransferase
MNITFMKAGIEYLDTLVDLRMEFIKDLHPEISDKEINNTRSSTSGYFTDLLEKELYIGYLGLNSDKDIICTAGLLIYELPPLDSACCRKIGHILNFYTKPEYRKQGCGTKLMEFIKASAKESGINRLFLNATDMGFGLYKKACFTEPGDRAMIYDL